MPKKQYWVNVKTAKTHPTRNNTHIKIIGENKTLCGRALSPEFDDKQAKIWKKTDKPNRRKICKQCTSVSKKLGNLKDKAVKDSLKTVSREPEIEEEELQDVTMDVQENLNVWMDEDEEYTFDKFLQDVESLGDNAKIHLNEILKDWESCPPEKSIKLFMKLDALKQFIASCERLKSN